MLSRFFGKLAAKPNKNDDEYQFVVASLSTKEIATYDTASAMYNIARQNFGNPDPVLKKIGRDIQVYRELLYHPHVSACVEQLTDRVTQQEWDIDRGRSKSRNAKLIKQVFNDIDDAQEGGLSKIFSECVMARYYGWQVFETPFVQIGSFFIPEMIVAKPQQWFTYGPNGELLFKSKENPSGEPLPPYQFHVLKHKSDYQNPYGIAQAAGCYYPVIFEKASWSFRTTFIESSGQAKVIIKVRRGTSQATIQKIVNDVANAVQDGVIAIPEDSSAEILKVNDKASSDIYHDYKRDCEADISKAILGSTLTVQEGDVGSYSLGKVHGSGLEIKMRSINRLVEQFFNRIIKTIFEGSDISGDRPTFVIYEEEKVDKERAERDEVLSRAGVKWTKQHFIAEYGFEEDEFEIESPTGEGAEFSSQDDLNALINAYDDLKKKSNPRTPP